MATVEKTKREDTGAERFEIHLGATIYVLSLEAGEKMARDILSLSGIEVAQLESSLADKDEETELWKQRVTFAEAKRIAGAEVPDYGLAAYMLRDLPLTIEADLSSLAHSISAETASDGDWVGLRDLWDKAFREALKKAGEVGG